ncbi:LysR family transcriptional regulator [Variovorax guangxiensis]|uniref:LysR family transcriptional regulator n=1 Tax=Variovorax guangxiensis TaxID=1775474 RepID=UPI00285BF7D3|nr:LysR family transcriptional regulator [Variovorax guangxiensis]MDR6858589.1 DNA-binding transcriptional LysR family regulator [Variovorax guangxiensis]
MRDSSHSIAPAEKMIDLNDLRVFAYVASLASFSLAADALQIHKSSVSRSIARLETILEASLLQRPTRKVLLTRRGNALKQHCEDILSLVNRITVYPGEIDARHVGALRGVVHGANARGAHVELLPECAHGERK